MNCIFEEKCCHFKAKETQHEKDLARSEVIDFANHMNKANRAFGNKDTEYYELQQNFGPLNKGAIFYWDKDDDIRGSIAEGCLKLCWSHKGDCQCGHAGDTFCFHAGLRKDPLLFKLAKWPEDMDKWENKAKEQNRKVYQREKDLLAYERIKRNLEEMQ